MSKWASVIGLGMTAFGILVGFFLPTIAFRWGSSETLTQEFWLQNSLRRRNWICLGGHGLSNLRIMAKPP